MDPVYTSTWEVVAHTGSMAEHSECHNCNSDDSDEICTPELELNVLTRTGIKQPSISECCAIRWKMCTSAGGMPPAPKDKTCVPELPELGWNMCTKTGIKHVYQGVQGACPWQAVTHTRGTAKHQWALCHRCRSKACLYRRAQCFWWLTKVSIMAQRFWWMTMAD